jgi:hypothetical protein
LQAFLQVVLVVFQLLQVLVAVVLVQPLADVLAVQGMGDWNRSREQQVPVVLAV